jgi:hypothetical protein
VNTIGPDEPVGSVHVDVLARREDRRRTFVTVPSRRADLPLDVPVAHDVVLRRLTLGPGGADDTVNARVALERTGEGEAKVSIELGFVRADERSTWAPMPAGLAVITVEDLPLPPGDDVLRLSVVIETQGPAVARALGRTVIRPAPVPRPFVVFADPEVAGVATLERGRLDARLQLPGGPGPRELRARLWADDVPVWSLVRRDELPDAPPVARLREPLSPPDGSLRLEVEAHDLWVHDGALDAALPDAPTPPTAGPGAVAVGPVTIAEGWTYCEDRPDLGRFRGVRLLLRNDGPAPVTLSFRFVPPGQERGIRSGGDLPPGGSDLFDLSDDGPAGGPARIELRVTTLGARSHRGVLPVVRFG